MRAILQSSVFAAAALLAAPAFAQSQDKPYCLESQVGARTCIYESLERCQHMAAMRSIGGRCVINPAMWFRKVDAERRIDAPKYCSQTSCVVRIVSGRWREEASP